MTKKAKAMSRRKEVIEKVQKEGWEGIKGVGERSCDFERATDLQASRRKPRSLLPQAL